MGIAFYRGNVAFYGHHMFFFSVPPLGMYMEVNQPMEPVEIVEKVDPTFISCPFCGEDDFDLFGLKIHIEMGWCDVYNNLTFGGKEYGGIQ